MNSVDMAVENEVLEGELRRALEEDPDVDSRRFISTGLSLIPTIGGAMSMLVVAGDEKRRQNQLRLLLLIARNTTATLGYIQSEIAVLMDRNQVFAIKAVLELGATMEITEARGISSITDNGDLDFTINFTEEISPYTFDVFGSGKVDIARAVQTTTSLRLQLVEGAPDRVALLVLRG